MRAAFLPNARARLVPGATYWVQVETYYCNPLWDYFDPATCILRSFPGYIYVFTMPGWAHLAVCQLHL